MESFDLHAGDLRTRIRVQRKASARQPGGLVATESWIDLGNSSDTDMPRYKYCQWIGYHGTEAIKQDILQASLSATVRLRYDPRINTTCRLLRGTEEYDIVSVDDIRLRHQWMELKVVRKEAG